MTEEEGGTSKDVANWTKMTIIRSKIMSCNRSEVPNEQEEIGLYPILKRSELHQSPTSKFQVKQVIFQSFKL